MSYFDDLGLEKQNPQELEPGQGMPLPELPCDAEHVTYWDDVEEVCKVAKLLFTRNCYVSFSESPNPFEIELHSNKCLTYAEGFVKAQRAFKTAKAEEFRAAETERSKKI